MITPEDTKEDPGNTEPANAGDGVITPLISCAAQVHQH
jgi:hypothetical protein